jgi:signal transduction histidine kinase
LAVRLETILRNLYSNAIKYQDYSKENPEAKFSIVNDHHTAYIRYKDNGIGIHEKYVDRIGEMFFRASEKSHGSGLGLYITRETIQRLGGTFTLTSEFGRFTEIEITLPNRLNQ